MARVVSTFRLADALQAEGFEPPKNCGDVQLEMPVDGLAALHYTVYVDDEDLAKIGRALERLSSNDT